MRPSEQLRWGGLLATNDPSAVVDAILGAIPSGAVIARAADGVILRVSDFAAQELGLPRAEIEGVMRVADLAERFQVCDASGRRIAPEEMPLARSIRGETTADFQGSLTSATGETIPFASSSAPIENAMGELIGGISSVTDLRPVKALEERLHASLSQRESLYRELTHRMKNHLHVMASLIRLDARDMTLTAADLAERMGARLQSLAAVYDGMTGAERGEEIEARGFVQAICRPYASDAVAVDIEVEPGDTALTPEQAAPLGMLVNEAVCNSFKHAFPEDKGHIWVKLGRHGVEGLHVEIVDDGVGWKPPAEERQTQGLALMRALAEQLNGAFSLADRPGGGARVIVDLPRVA
jgi:two-component sensor histidine kinase